MRIDSMSSVSKLYGTSKLKKVNQAYQASVGDRLEISQIGKDIQTVKKAVSAAPDIREDKVAAMKSALAGGYCVSDNDLADKLLESFAI